MIYCTRCLYHNKHPLNITFDERGVCSGCLIHEEKDNLDWSVRFKRLKKIVYAYKKKNNNYDCIVPVTGGQDSFFIVHTVKKRLGLNPLLVSYNSHYNTLGGLRNLSLIRTIFDCDYIQKVISPEIVKKINLTTLESFGSMYWHVIAGQTVFPVQVAIDLNIPLIIWGVHQGCDQVGMFSHMDEVEMTRKFRKEHDLMTFEAHNLLNINPELKEHEVSEYNYPEDKELARVGVRGIYLSNFIRWDSKGQHEKMIKKYNYETYKQIRTADSYNNMDCNFYNGIHDYLKILKHGYSKITDHVTREIRLKRLSREVGIKIVEKYQNLKSDDFELFFKFNRINQKYFRKIEEKFRNKKFWHKEKNGWSLKYKPKKTIKSDLLKTVKLRSSHNFNFLINNKDNKNELFLLHRAWRK